MKSPNPKSMKSQNPKSPNSRLQCRAPSIKSKYPMSILKVRHSHTYRSVTIAGILHCRCSRLHKIMIFFRRVVYGRLSERKREMEDWQRLTTMIERGSKKRDHPIESCYPPARKVLEISPSIAR